MRTGVKPPNSLAPIGRPRFPRHGRRDVGRLQTGATAAFDGYLTQAVKFGFGLLGHLDKGGHFEVKQAEVVPAIGT
jgi:hypothetical protein